jgi:hypothetical protein
MPVDCRERIFGEGNTVYSDYTVGNGPQAVHEREIGLAANGAVCHRAIL